MRATREGEDVFLVIGSSFAIDEHHLVTNAHVVDGAAQLFSLLEPDMELVVVQHESRLYCSLDEMYVHPEYDASRILSTPDVGILVPDCTLPTFVPVADTRTLRDLAVLDDVFMCGFPGDVTLVDIELGSNRPRATCLTGNITGLRPFDLDEPTTPLNASVVQHDIQTSGGTSGGPIFDGFGRVIAINSAGTTDETASNRFAIRIDEIWALLEDVNAGRVQPVALVPSPIQTCPNASYWNADYSFGFDPPPTFDGPFADASPSTFDLVAADFVFDQFLRIEVRVSTTWFTHDGWLDSWIQTKRNGHQILLDRHDIVMASGVPATLLEWGVPLGDFGDFYWIELWAVNAGLEYSFRALMLPGDFVDFGSTIRTSFESVCIE